MKSLYYRTITPLAGSARRWHWLLAGGLLALMFGLGLSSMVGESAIVDEVAHIPAGYSYLHYGDYRLNPEHPPLIKDLAGLPLQFMHLKFPDTLSAWTTEANGQWEAGWNFLYHIGNSADDILFWARLPILLLAIGFGWVLYLFVLRRWGRAVALLTLLFYTLSPNIIAHSHYVTTDLGASVFIFLALISFVRFIEDPSGRNLILLSLGLAGAQLAKFNAVLLFPFLLVVTGGIIAYWRVPKVWTERAKLYVGGLVSASFISLLWVWLYYIPHTLRMPEGVQDHLIEGSLWWGQMSWLAPILTSMNNWAILKPLVQYFLGVGMVFNRVAGGNVTYFNGEVTSQSYHMYFPQLFIMKTQIAFLLLGAIALGVLVMAVWRRRRLGLSALFGHSVRHRLLAWTIGGFALFYFAFSVVGNLNLGIRHILPVYVPLFIMVAIVTVKLARRLAVTKWRVVAAGTLVVLLGWYAMSTLLIHPYYTAYFNEFGGGPAHSDRYFSDSSVDWGQDLRRLKQYVLAHPEINHLAVDYFGGGDPQYYFCARRYDEQHQLVANASGYDCSGSVYEFWHSEYGPYTGQYIAVSETFLENDRYYSAKRGEAGYQYLRDREPIAKIGYSIYLYKLY